MSTSDEEEPEVFEIEKILQAIVHWKRGKKIYWRYFVKWKGYDVSENTWEPQEQFEDAPVALDDFWRSVDTDGRDLEDASLFKVGEEFSAGSASLSPSRRKPRQKKQESKDRDEDDEKPSQAASTSTSSRRSYRKKAEPVKADDEPRSRAKAGKTSVSSDEDDSKLGPRKRSRPRRFEDEAPEPKKKGRPSKSEEVEPRSRAKAGKSSVSSDEEEPKPSTTKKRGRPRNSEVQKVEKEREEEPPLSRRSVRFQKDEARSSDDDRPLRPRKKAKLSPVKSKAKGKAKRKAYESDSSGSSPPRVVPVSKGKTIVSVDIPVRNPDAEPKIALDQPDSPGGSLFSGGDEDAEHDEEEEIVGEPAAVEETSAQPAPASEPVQDVRASSVSAGDSAALRRSESLDTPNGRPSTTALPAHRQRAANPLVKRIEDPMLSATVQERILARRVNDAPSSQSPASGSGVASSSSARLLPTSRQKPILAPSGLLTFSKGKLTTVQRPKVMPAPESPPQVTTQDLAPPIEQQEPLEEAPQDTVLTEAQSASNGVVANDDAAMYVDVLGDIGMDAVGELEPMESAIPDELLLHPWNNGTDDTALPLFYEDAPTGLSLEEGEEAGRSRLDFTDGADLPEFDDDAQTGVSVEEGELAEPSTTATVAEAEASSSSPIFQTTGLLAGSSSSAWKQSTIFGLATPPTTAGASYSFEPFELASGDLVVKPARFFVNIHLDPSHVIPVVLKDVLAATYDITSRLNDLLAGTPGGPPGKLYVPDVLQLVKTGGSCARIALIDESTAEHKNCFDQLRLELEGGKLFIVVLGSTTVVLFSSQNIQVGEGLLVPSTLLGLSKTLIMSHIVVESPADFVKYAMDAVDLKLL